MHVRQKLSICDLLYSPSSCGKLVHGTIRLLSALFAVFLSDFRLILQPHDHQIPDFLGVKYCMFIFLGVCGVSINLICYGSKLVQRQRFHVLHRRITLPFRVHYGHNLHCGAPSTPYDVLLNYP